MFEAIIGGPARLVLPWSRHPPHRQPPPHPRRQARPPRPPRHRPPRHQPAPRRPAEQQIARIWADLLGLDPARIGIHDDFFTLGGHSILAARLALRISASLNTDIPLHQVFTHPTITAQASWIDKHAGVPADNAMVPMGGSPDLPPLILVHPLGGTLFQYQELAASLSSAYQVFGVHGDLMGSSGAASLAGRVSDYARYVALVLGGRRPVIAGWSAGGVIAHELAIQLASSDVMAERLILIDTSPPADDDAADAAILDRLRPLVLEDGPGRLLAEPGAGEFLASLGVSPAAFIEADADTAIALMDFWRDMLTSLACHKPDRFEGPASRDIGGR
jgi:pimeloyl-ACP methyl ester carboxylesterase